MAKSPTSSIPVKCPHCGKEIGKVRGESRQNNLDTRDIPNNQKPAPPSHIALICPPCAKKVALESGYTEAQAENAKARRLAQMQHMKWTSGGPQ